METAWYDCVVVGCGGIGSGTVYWLARAGNRVLGLEQYKLGHNNGGSQDFSRTIRMDYADDDYINLCRGAYSCWNRVEKESGLQLIYKTGGISFAEKDTTGERYIAKTEEALRRHRIRCERLDGELLNKRFPQFSTKTTCKALFIPDNGVLDAELANAVHVQLARKHGATFLEEVTVTGIGRSTDGLPLVRTTRGDFRCRRVVVTAGAWNNNVLKSIGVHVPLVVTQEQVSYFATPHVIDFTKERFPCWSYHSPEGLTFYGLPLHGNTGAKVGMDAAGKTVTPETRSFETNQENLNKCIQMCQTYIPRSLGPVLMTKTCLYAMTPDRHFVVDTCRRNGFPEVAICYGAGHAFKFASVLGKVLADLVTEGRTTEFNIKPFSLDREAVTNPNFQPAVQIGSWPTLNQSEASKL